MARLSLEARRQNFIDAAIEVVTSEGVAQATTRRIAEAAKSPLAGLHYCFETKEDLFVAVVETYLGHELEHAQRNVEPGMGLHKAIEAILRGFEDWLAANHKKQQATFELFHWALRNPDYAHLARNIYQTATDKVELFLRDSCRKEETGIDIEMLARHIIALWDGHAMQRLAGLEGHTLAIASSIRILQLSLEANDFEPGVA